MKKELEEKILKITCENIKRKVTIADEEFETISAWYHLPLIQLAFTKIPKVTAESGAKYFGIAVDDASIALGRLCRLGFVEKKGKFYQRVKSVVTTTDVSSIAIKQFHLQMLHKAKDALFLQPFKRRYFSSVTLRIPPDKLMDYKKIMQEAEEKMVELSKKYKYDEQTEVYHFSSQLFSLKKEE